MSSHWNLPLKGSGCILTSIRGISTRRRMSLIPMRSPGALRDSTQATGTSTTRHIRLAILVINGVMTNSRSVRGIRGSEIGGRLVRGQSIGLLSIKLGIAGVLGLALPELPAWRAGGVAVVGGGAESLLFLVMADEHEFDEDRKEEEDTGGGVS